MRRYTAKNVKEALFLVFGREAREAALCLRHSGFWPRLKHPKTFQDKIIWLKLHYRNPLAHVLADKSRVRELVAGHGGEQYLSNYYGEYKSTEEIDYAVLPERFVLKANHGSGWNIICADKSKLDRADAAARMRTWLSSDYGRLAHEWCYLGIEPRIVCEEYLLDAEGKIPKDFKIFCFGGEPYMIQVDFSRFETHRQNYYDTEWNRLPITRFVSECSDTDEPKPERLTEMLEFSRRLSRDLPFARVDLYLLPDRIVFGEITLYPMSGYTRFVPHEWNRRLGDMLDLSRIPTEYIE